MERTALASFARSCKMIYLVTGWPGAGKSTIAVQHAIHRYASKGRRVVSNFPIDFAAVSATREGKIARASCYVIPDRPTRADLDLVGFGGESEEKAGLLIVDEAGGWLNARTWNASERDKIIDWLTQSRKFYWDIILIAQAANMLDKQVREAVCELVVRIRRLDRVKVLGISLPKAHFGIVRYGLDANAPVTEKWIYRGTDAHKCFMSYRIFGGDAAHYNVLPASISKWAGIPIVDAWSAFWALPTQPTLRFIGFWIYTLAAIIGLIFGFSPKRSIPAKRGGFKLSAARAA